jgi:hypothetical protein
MPSGASAIRITSFTDKLSAFCKIGYIIIIIIIIIMSNIGIFVEAAHQ